MAKCDEGYRCEVCGRDVASITDSDLYLRFVIGDLDPELLHVSAERHIRCNPVLAQFIEHESFERVTCEGEFDRQLMDPHFARTQTELVTRGYRRLLEVASMSGDRDVTCYPLPEAIEKYRK